MSTSTYTKSYGVQAFLQFVGKPLTMSMKIEEDSQVFSVDLSNFSLKDLITGIVQIVKPGYELSIPKPWSYILDHEVPPFTLKLKAPKNGGKVEFGISFDPHFDDFGLNITKIEVFARSIREINFNMEGNLDIFGLNYKLDDLFNKGEGVNLLGAEGLPTPAPKPSLIDLKFIGIGQHLRLKNAAKFNHVNDAVNAMSTAFKLPTTDTVIPKFGTEIEFNNDSQWLFGLDIEIMKTVALQIVFNDPVLYGLYISLSGEKAKALAGLEFEILYKKITDDIGVYQLELKLPDAIRNMEFGAVSVTLPVIAIWIYTNGNFKIDLGFPYNNNFSRSFTVQSFPFIGQGGFYFAYLNGATSTTTPKTDLGTFDPVLEFGLGMNIGLGKTFNKGILSAGLTLTFYGILEGTLAWFKPYDTLPVGSNNLPVKIDESLTDFFYKLKGTFGIVGHIYGTVNFAIISATLDIVVYAQATVTIEAAEPIYLSFEAGVSVKLTVKINLGLFKVKIHLSFSATVRESFTLGSASNAQWNHPLLSAAADNNKALAPTPLTEEETHVFIPMNWGQTFTQGTAQDLIVDLIPLFSADKSNDTQTAVGVSTLFVENNRGQSNDELKKLIIDKNALATTSAFQPFDKVCISMLSWIFNTTYTANAAETFEDVLSKKITNVTIANILYTIDNYDAQENPNPDNGTVPFTYEQIADFIKALFLLNITDPNHEHKQALEGDPTLKVSEADQSDLFVTIFPMIPQLFMSNSENDDVIDFDTHNGVNNAYLQKVIELVKQFTNNTTNLNNDGDEAIDVTDVESMAELIFRDYFSLVGKSLLQSASDIMEVYNYTLPNNSLSLQDIADTYATTPAALVTTNKVQAGLLVANSYIHIAAAQYALAADETFTTLEALKTYTTSGDDWATAFITANERVKLFIPLIEIQLPDGDKTKNYRVLEDDTFESIASKNDLTTTALKIQIITLNADQKILSAQTEVVLPTLTDKIATDDTFLSIATHYNIELDELSAANETNTDILVNGAVMMIQYVSELSIGEILNAVYQKDFFTGAGGSASRFALHGVRLPNVITDGDPGTDLEGLYKLSGQQFALPTITDPNTFTYTFTLSKTNTTEATTTDPLPWILFNGETFTGSGEDQKLATLPYTLLSDEVQLVAEFQQLTFDPTILKSPSNLQLYQDQTKTFAFNNPIVWQQEGTDTPSSIWTFSKSLTGIANQSPTIDLNVSVQEKPNAARTITPVDNSKYYYGTLLPLSIRKINDNENNINQKTFEVFGTDATGIETLTALLQSPNFNTSYLKNLTILYSSDPSNDESRELRSIPSDELLLLLINTNLSTETNPTNVTQAEGDQKITNTPIDTFIERVWKASLVKSGGYYLYYDTSGGNTLPSNLFSENGEAEIYFMISYDIQAIDHTIQAYMNTSVLSTTVDTSQELLFGEWQVDLTKNHDTLLLEGRIERNAIIAPGNVGFKLTRENPNKKFGDAQGNITEPNYPYDLEQQYNLLNFHTIASGNFTALNSVIPVGPTDNQDSTGEDTSSNSDSLEPWKYNKAMPVANFHKGASKKTETISLPPSADLSPYLGLTETLSIGFDWQDNYGNIYDTTVSNLDYTILYFDELIPLSAWPALTLEYSFVTPVSDNNFDLSLNFIPGDKYSWNPKGDHPTTNKKAVLKQAQADLEKYISIYYQIVQSDLAISFLSSTDPDTSYPKEAVHQTTLKTGIIDYINNVSNWIFNFIKDPHTNNQYKLKKPYQYTYTYKDQVIATNSLDIFALSIDVLLTRNEDTIDPQFILQESPKKFVEGVQQIQTAAKPKSSGLPAPPNPDGTVNTSDSNTSLLALTNFAYSFENAFSDQKLKVTATYVRGEDSSLTEEKEQELYVVRFKDYGDTSKNGIGYDIKFKEALYYAPQPLANFLISLDNIAIQAYSSYATGTEDTISKTYNNIDVETWAQNFLSVLETTFAPELSLPITMVDHLNGSSEKTGILAGLLNAKETLAKAIALQTIPILQDDNMQNAGWEMAREKLRQQLLINLKDGYNINAVVQYNTDLNTPYPNSEQTIAPNLYGKPYVGTPEETSDEKNYALSTAKIPLRDLDSTIPDIQNSYLTYTFTTQNPTLESNLPLPINYQINHMEFDIKTLETVPSGVESEDLKNYDLSKWLTFIRPLDAQVAGKEAISHIPIPIREYPVLPAFESQIFTSQVNNTTKNVTIEEAKLSDFSFDYTLQNYVAQDTYHFEIYFNAKETDWHILENAKGLTTKQEKLFSKLAQFDFVKADFLATFNDKLPNIDASISETDLESITEVLGSYEDLVSDVSQAWLDLFTPDSQAAAEPSVDVIKVEFKLEEFGSNPSAGIDANDNYFETSITNWVAQTILDEKTIDYIQVPTINLPNYTTEIYVCDTINCKNPIPLPAGKKASSYLQIIFRYKDSDGNYLTFEKGVSIKKRTVDFTNLSVLQIQNGWAGFYVERNANLSNTLKTSPEFIYTTPVRRFSNPITPSSLVTNNLPLTPLTEPNNNLSDYLKHLLSELMSVSSSAVTPVKLKILINYTYSIGSQIINIPVLLISPTIFDSTDISGEGTAITALNKGILAWFKNNTPNQNKGELVFAITFYSSMDGDNTLPLLTLEDITLNVDNVSDIKALNP